MLPGISEWQAWAVNNCRKTYWPILKNGHVQRAISKERLAQAGYDSILDRCESVHLFLKKFYSAIAVAKAARMAFCTLAALSQSPMV